MSHTTRFYWNKSFLLCLMRLDLALNCNIDDDGLEFRMWQSIKDYSAHLELFTKQSSVCLHLSPRITFMYVTVINPKI